MRAHAELEIRPDGRLGRVVSAPPITFRQAGDTVYQVGTAAGPLGDDRLSTRVVVADGATLVFRSVAATIVYAGSGSVQQIDVRVGRRATLDWHPEPVIATSGCHHIQDVRVELEEGARLDWAEELVLGRHGEQPGKIDLRLRVDVGGRPLLRHQLVVGQPGWDGGAVLGQARACGLRLWVAPERPPAFLTATAVGEGWSWMPLEGPGWLLVATAPDLPELRRRAAAAGAPPPVR